MGLPQELVDHVMDMLCNDTRALKACSLTCKAMFASTRHLIHETLELCPKNSLRVLTRGEKRRYERGDRNVLFHFISFMDERGLLQYVRRVHIYTPYRLTPGTLSPHLHRFQLLNQVHTLAIDHFYPENWESYHSTGFAHFYPTLTSLTLRGPCNHDWLLNFALRFPNLENLSLEKVGLYYRLESNLADIATPERTPPLRGCLRLVGYGTVDWPVRVLLREPLKGFNFRSVELCDFPGSQAQHALNACARTLEILTIKAYYSSGNLRVPFFPPLISDQFSDPSIEHAQLWYLNLTEMVVLHQLTVRTTFDPVSIQDRDNPLLGMLSSIVSPVFCKFVLELGGSSPLPERESMKEWGPWRGFDNLVEEKFARNRGFRFIIRTSEPPDWEELRRRAECCFPVLAGRGCIYLQTSYQV